MRNHILRSYAVVLLLVLTLALQACSGQQPNGNAGPTTPSTQPAPQAPPSYQGFLDSVDCNAIIAWGWDTNRPNDPVKFDIYDGSVLIATVIAEAFRQDLLDAGKGNGKHYVFWPIPVQLKDGKKHVITVKFAGSTLELGAPKEITCNVER